MGVNKGDTRSVDYGSYTICPYSLLTPFRLRHEGMGWMIRGGSLGACSFVGVYLFFFLCVGGRSLTAYSPP